MNEMEKKYQMMRIIQMFSERRSQLLIAVAKTFLQMNKDNCSETRICSSALAKYTIEKWKASRYQLRISKEANDRAQRYYIYSLL